MFTHALTLSTVEIKHYEEKIPTQLESNPRFSHLEADVGPLHHRVAAAMHWMGVMSLSEGGAKVLEARLLRHTASIDAASADLDKNMVLANPRAFSPS